MDNPSAMPEKQNKPAIGVPSVKYSMVYGVCWRCKKKIKLFTWSAHKMFGDDIPPEPRPKTLSYKFSKMAGHKYWVNECFYCGSIQGDWFLYMEPGGVFFDCEKITFLEMVVSDLSK